MLVRISCRRRGISVFSGSGSRKGFFVVWFFRSEARQRLFLAAFVVIYFIPVIPLGPSMFDDSGDLSGAEQFHDALKADGPARLLDFVTRSWDPESGRLMLLLRPWFYFQYLICGRSFACRHLLDAVLWLLITQLIFTVTRRLSTSKKAPLPAAMLPPLFWPATMPLLRTHLLEPIQIVFLLSALLLLLRAEEKARDTAAPAWKTALPGSGCIFFTLLAIGMKETGITLLPALVLLSLPGVWRGGGRIRKLRLGIVLSAVAVTLAWAGLFFAAKAWAGSYTQVYSMSDPGQVLVRLLSWRDLIMAGFGPIVSMGAALFIMQLAHALKTRHLPDRIRWRLGLAVLGAGFFTIVLPWPYILGRLVLPGITVLSILLAGELAEFHDACADRESPDGIPLRYRVYVVLGGLAFWIMPPLDYPIAWPAVAGRIALAALFFTILFQALRGKEASAAGAALRRTGRAAVLFAIAAFLAYALPGLWSEYHRARMLGVDAQAPMFETVNRYAPEKGQVIIDNDSMEWSIQFNSYSALFHDRKDITYVSRYKEEIAIRPEDTIIQFSQLPLWNRVYGFHQLPPLAPEGRRIVTHTDSAIWFNPYRAQPGRLLMQVLGYPPAENVPLPCQWSGLVKKQTYAWTVYLPENTPSRSP
jgi:hypothetical protein